MKFKTTRRITMFAFAACAAIPAIAADWYVSPTGAGGGTSTSDRGDAMTVLFNGQVASGDTIHFAAGTYDLDVSKSPEGHVPGYGARRSAVRDGYPRQQTRKIRPRGHGRA